MKDCRKCKNYVLNVDNPRISRCASRHHGMVIDWSNDIMLMATEGRLPNNVCGPSGKLFEARAYK